MNDISYKSEIRLLGWDDASFEEDTRGNVPIVGTITRGSKSYVDGFLYTEIEKDGFDCTDQMIDSVNNSKHKDQLKALLLDGITFAGFNVVDIERLNKETELPVIAVTRKRTDFDKFKEAMKNVSNFDRRWRNVKKAGEMKSLELDEGKIYYQFSGISNREAQEIIKLSLHRSMLPEPIRISHLMASAISDGESNAGV